MYSMKERVCTSPAGVQYDFPQKEATANVLMSRILFDAWGYDAIAITPNYLERAIQRRRIIINNVDYDACSEALVFIVIHPEYATPLRSSLKVLASLEYPLGIAYETFHMNYGGRHVQFTRNASSVTIRDQRRHIVFVAPSLPNENIVIGGLQFDIAQDPGANGVLQNNAAVPFDGALVACVQDVLHSDTNLREEWSDMMRIISGGAAYDWSPISEMISHLVPRFPPQAETTRQGGVGGQPLAVANLNCPPLFVNQDPNAADFMAQVRAAVLPANDAGYHHDRVVNCFDVVTAPRDVADTWPMIRVGRWSNAAEILTGLQLMSLPLIETNVGNRSRVREGNRGYLRRARAAREACELVKGLTGACNAPDGIADPALNISRGKWQREVNGSTSLRHYGECTLSQDVEKTIYSLTVNLNRQGYAGTMTGNRVPALVGAGEKEPSLTRDERFLANFEFWDDRGLAGVVRGTYVSRTQAPSPSIDRMLGKIDITQINGIAPFALTTSKALIPLGESILTGRIHSGFTEAMARGSGWDVKVRQAGPLAPLFGWGLKPVLRDWVNERDVLVPLPGGVKNVYESPSYGAYLQLITLDATPILPGLSGTGFDVDYYPGHTEMLSAAFTRNMHVKKEDFRTEASIKDEPPQERGAIAMASELPNVAQEAPLIGADAMDVANNLNVAQRPS